MDTAIRTTVVPTPRLVAARVERLLFVANAVGLTILVFVVFLLQPSQPTMRVGSVASETVIAQHRVTFIDRVATQAKKKQVMETTPPAYLTDTRLASRRKQEAAVFFSSAAPVIASTAPTDQKLSSLHKLLPQDVTSDSLQQFATQSPNDLKVVRDRSLALLGQAVGWRFDYSDRVATEMSLLGQVSAHLTVLQRTAVSEVLSTFLAPTLIINTDATEARQKAAAKNVAPVTSVIYPGEVIVRRGDLITPTVMEKLTALGLQTRRVGWQERGASLLFASVIIALLFWYLHSFHSSLAGTPRLLLLVDASVAVTVIVALLVTPDHVLLPFFLPAAAASTFAAVLIAPEACMAIAFVTAILAGWITANSFELTIYYFLTAAAGVLAIRQLRQLKQFIVAGCAIALFALATMVAFGLAEHNYDLAALQDFVLAAAFNGFVSSTLALGAFVVLSGYFGVTTALQLLELGQPNQVLLRRLMVKAPGTYNHSLIVASMVEHAAEETGANSLVAKVGALYHDVGKTANPHCFVENQMGMGNIHDELRPEESARLIRGHVSQGLRLARQHRLPRMVLDAIAEHHGTMRITYFLHRAHENGTSPADLSLYTYPGPKPQSKETALLMLADGCESAVRSSSDHSARRIEEIVDRIFQERIEQGQLSECPLTLRDLDLARDAFLSVLNGLYHPRIDYPEPSDMAVEIREREALP